MKFLIGKKEDRPPEMNEETFEDLRRNICEFRYVADYDPDKVGCTMLVNELFPQILRKPEIVCLQGQELIDRVEREIGAEFERVRDEHEKKFREFLTRTRAGKE